MTDGLFDTTFFIDFRRGLAETAGKLWDSVEGGSRTGAYSAVTAYELWVGQRFSREEELLYESMFVLLEPVPISVGAAKQAGQWLRNRGTRSESVFRDALIAAEALERNEKVVTRNARGFSSFPGVEVETY